MFMSVMVSGLAYDLVWFFLVWLAWILVLFGLASCLVWILS
jgi:hypothetical protein